MRYANHAKFINPSNPSIGITHDRISTLPATPNIHHAKKTQKLTCAASKTEFFPSVLTDLPLEHQFDRAEDGGLGACPQRCRVRSGGLFADPKVKEIPMTEGTLRMDCPWPGMDALLAAVAR
jgi:hypothetical protein